MLDRIKEIEDALGLVPLPLMPSLASRKLKRYEKPSAEKWLIWGLIFLTAGFVTLSIYNFGILIYQAISPQPFVQQIPILPLC